MFLHRHAKSPISAPLIRVEVNLCTKMYYSLTCMYIYIESMKPIKKLGESWGRRPPSPPHLAPLTKSKLSLSRHFIFHKWSFQLKTNWCHLRILSEIVFKSFIYYSMKSRWAKTWPLWNPTWYGWSTGWHIRDIGACYSNNFETIRLIFLLHLINNSIILFNKIMWFTVSNAYIDVFVIHRLRNFIR